MKLRVSIIAAGSVAALANVSVQAQSQAPGLWENSVVFKTQNGEMEKAIAEMQRQMDALPAEQRKAIEQMMASRGVGIGPHGTTFKVCVTKDDAARQLGPKMADANCTQQVVERSAGRLKVKWQCSGKNPSSGQGDVTFSSDKAYTGKAVTTTTIKGQVETVNIEQSGRWLGADCGTLRPMPSAARP